MVTKQISIFLENRPGALTEVCGVLEEASVSMRAMCLAEAEDFGILRIIVDDVYRTMTALKENGYIAKLTDVLTIEIEDRTGALISALALLGEAGLNLEYSYAFLAKQAEKAYLVIRVADPAKALEVLQGKGIRVIGQEALARLFGD